MTKVVYKSLKPGRTTARSVETKRVATPDGRKTVHKLDANSASFDSDLQYVFSRNVAKARRENKRIVGTADVGPRKA